MISKKDIIKLAKKVVKRQKGLRDHQIIHPQREWFVGLTVGLVAFVGGGVWSAATYLDVTERDIENAASVEIQQTVYRTEMINAALEQFRERKEMYDRLLENRVVPPPVILEAEEEIIPDPELETEPVPEIGPGSTPPPVDLPGALPPPPAGEGTAGFDVPQ